MPFRYVIFKQTAGVFVLSKVALEYLEKINFCSDKLMLNRGGIYPKGANVLSEKKPFRIVSCSNVIRIKRIDKIIAALDHVTSEIEWIHFGEGDLISDLKEMALKLPSNVTPIFKGSVSNKSIISFYKTESVNLFIHTSETEGLGLAIIEAQVFGIPAVVIGVEGVLDIVTNETGIVLKPEANQYEIANSIESVLASEKNTNEYRDTIIEICLEKFDAKNNYLKMATAIFNAKH